MLPCIYEPLQLVYPDEVPGRYLVSYGVFIVFGSTSELSGGCHYQTCKIVDRVSPLQHLQSASRLLQSYRISGLRRPSCAIFHRCILSCGSNPLTHACLDIVRLISSVTVGSRLDTWNLTHQPQHVQNVASTICSTGSYLQLSCA
jgi:hypothetical protein